MIWELAFCDRHSSKEYSTLFSKRILKGELILDTFSVYFFVSWIVICIFLISPINLLIINHSPTKRLEDKKTNRLSNSFMSDILMNIPNKTTFNIKLSVANRKSFKSVSESEKCTCADRQRNVVIMKVTSREHCMLKLENAHNVWSNEVEALAHSSKLNGVNLLHTENIWLVLLHCNLYRPIQ